MSGLSDEWSKFFEQHLKTVNPVAVVKKRKQPSSNKTSSQPKYKRVPKLLLQQPKKKSINELVQELQNKYSTLQPKFVPKIGFVQEDEDEDDEEEDDCEIIRHHNNEIDGNEDVEDIDDDAILNSSESENYNEKFVNTYFHPSATYLDLTGDVQISNFQLLYDAMRTKKPKWENFINTFTKSNEESISLLNLLLLSNVFNVAKELFDSFNDCVNIPEVFKNRKYSAIQISLCENKMKSNSSNNLFYITFNVKHYLEKIPVSCHNAFYQFVVFVLFLLIRYLDNEIGNVTIFLLSNIFKLVLPFKAQRKHYFINFILNRVWFNCWHLNHLEYTTKVKQQQKS